MRSHLYVPGDRPELFEKALERGADALILDLEDAVVWSRKPLARQAVSEFLTGCGPSSPSAAHPQIWVRITAEAWRDDLESIIQPGLHGLCLAKAASAAYVREVALAVGSLEAAGGVKSGAVVLSPLLEDARAVLAAVEIACADRVVRLQVGEVDLAADCGMEPSADGAELNYVRSVVVLASAAAALEPPVGPVSTDFRDLEALRRSTQALKRRGYGSRACIHPAQVKVVNEVFSPTPEEIERAHQLVHLYEAAHDEGAGVLVDASGRMVDLAVVRTARRVLAGANRL